MTKRPTRIAIPGMKERIHDLVAQKGLTQSALAKIADLEVYQVSRIIAGALPEEFDRLKRFALALDVPWEWLLVGDEGARVLQRHLEKRGAVAAPSPPHGGSVTPPNTPEREVEGRSLERRARGSRRAAS